MKQNWNFSPYHYILYSIAIIIGILIGILIHKPLADDISVKKDNTLNKKNKKISDVLQYISDKYVDTVNTEELLEKALESIMLNLDPHSAYIPADELQNINELISGNFEGIGIQFRIENDTVVVLHTIANGPSEKVGLKSGDRIIAVNNKNIAGIGITNKEVMKLLRGKKGTKVNVDILRKEVSENLRFTITRDVIPTTSVDFYNMLNSKTAYIKLSSFTLNSEREFSEALKELKKQGMENLILDLRGNGGGLLDVAIKIADHFFHKDVLLVYTEGLKHKKQKYYSTQRGLFKNGKVVIIIDEFSASASEIIAGAIQDNKRGYVVGRPSFGKGLVQEQLPLNDGSAIRLTVAKYYTPSGKCIQRPYDKGNLAYYKDFYEQLTKEYEISNIDEDTNTINKSITKEIGGIIPDIYVPHPQFYKNEIVTILYTHIFQFSFNYTDKNRTLLLNKYKNAHSFVKSFQVSDSLWNEFIAFATSNSKKLSNNITSNVLAIDEKEFLKTHLKANIGRNLYNYAGYFPVVQKIDNALIEALKLLEQ